MKRRKVLLVNPNQMKPPVSPVALDYLAQSLEEKGFLVQVLDLAFSADAEADIQPALKGSDPLLVGVTVRNLDDSYLASQDFCLERTKGIIDLLKAHSAAPLVDDPEVFELCTEQIIRTRAALAPDGYMLTHDEIRCAGWEPSQEKSFRSSGELFAFNVRRCLEIARGEGGGKPVYIWSDMYDPYHNARANYYFVKGSVSKSWEGLDPGVTVVEWGEQAKAAKSLAFFSGRDHRLMIAAFYDGDVDKDHGLWMKAVGAAPRIEGVMYTTWENDYSKLEEFAEAWWGGGR